MTPERGREQVRDRGVDHEHESDPTHDRESYHASPESEWRMGLPDGRELCQRESA
jgi:hypothetical protein